jgi:outer membrane protein OmpA-like peptidoglycan-associated protein
MTRRALTRWLAGPALAIACSGGHPAPSPARPSTAPSGGRTHRIVTSTSTSIELLDAIAFADDTTELTTPSCRTLDRVADALIANPSIRVIEVRGHGDAQPQAPQGAELAQERADVVAAYLIGHGVAASRLVTRGASSGGLGSSSDDARSRQVEFLILVRQE